MARLNEPVVPTESIESLKKRFMRQNRDLAKVNSVQSMRLRSLENEISSLLAENLSLREQVSHHKLELESGKAQRISEHTIELKTQLEQKLQEIGALIGGLGNPPRAKRASQSKGRISILQNNQSPVTRRWRDEADQEGRLPPILEHKSYPRRTLESQEIHDMANSEIINSTDSPEIGPPPVSQFVDEDPVKIDLPKKDHSKTNADDSGIDPSLAINLEQRRKRKDNGSVGESRRSSRSEPPLGDSEAGTLLKAGAKRKLSVREDEEVEAVPKTTKDAEKALRTRDDTQDTRKYSTAESTASDTQEVAPTKSVPKEPSVAPIRKVLAPKSVNNSPRKAVRKIVSEEGKPNKPAPSIKHTDGERKQTRQEPLHIPVLDLNPSPVETEIQLPGPEPETPAGIDLFSPPLSQPSTTRQDSRDTPPPAGLGQSSEGPRPSRRARGAVSYAEPNLRDKMRRPTKDLIDAVAGDNKVIRTGSVVETDGNPTTITKFKTEPETEQSWKEIPSIVADNSPLSNKGPTPDSVPSNISTHRKRRESLLQQTESELGPSSAASAIVAMLAENRKIKAAASREKGKERGLDAGGIANAVSHLDIREHKDPSPTFAAKESRATSASRRFSALPRDSQVTEESEASDMEVVRKSDAVASRRRQSSLGLKSSTSRPELTSREVATERALKRPLSTTAIGAAPVDSRSDRISARRRSMML